jgi:hypothetical protein
VLGELTGRTLPELLSPPENPAVIDAERFTDTYSTELYDLVVSQDEDRRIRVDQGPKGPIAEQFGLRPERSELVHYRGDSLIPLLPDNGFRMPHAFVGDDGTGHALYLHIGRAVRRAGA